MTREEEFKQKLFALLREYKVEMSVKDSDDGRPYIEFFSSVVLEDIDFQIRWENGRE